MSSNVFQTAVQIHVYTRNWHLDSLWSILPTESVKVLNFYGLIVVKRDLLLTSNCISLTANEYETLPPFLNHLGLLIFGLPTEILGPFSTGLSFQCLSIFKRLLYYSS